MVNYVGASSSDREVIDRLVSGEHVLLVGFQPRGGNESIAPFLEGPESRTPASLSDLDEAVVRSYDLTISAAVDAQIPVVGAGSGGMNRRVIVLERAAFRRIPFPPAEVVAAGCRPINPQAPKRVGRGVIDCLKTLQLVT